MRIVQLIDSLEPGGAERMAVSIANGFGALAYFSGLVVTRSEGALRDTIDKKVHYKFVSKKSTFDFKALLLLISFLKSNKVEILHAHGTSYFFAVLAKLACPSIKLFWHDHHGNRVNSAKSNRVIKYCSLLFTGVFTVNEELKSWSEQHLFCSNITFVPNFTPEKPTEEKVTFLMGETGKRIVCLANLRKPKNHITILSAFHASEVFRQGWTLHFIGKDSRDNYSDEIKDFIRRNDLDENVFLYDSRNDIRHILSQADFGILASNFEGFPVTLLEYGMAKLAVITTDVGYCPQIVTDNVSGLVFSPLNSAELQMKILLLTADQTLREKFGEVLAEGIRNTFSEKAVLELLENKYNSN